MARKIPFDVVASAADQGMLADAEALAARLKDELAPVGAARVTREQELQVMARNWNDRTTLWGKQQLPFREWLQATLGNANLLDLFGEGEARGLLKGDAEVAARSPVPPGVTIAPRVGPPGAMGG